MNLANRSKKITLLSAATILALAIGGCSSDSAPKDSTAAEATLIRVAYPHASTSGDHEVLKAMAESIAARTEGRIKLELYPDGQLGSNADLLDQAVGGGDVAAFIDASSAAERGAAEMGILSGPYLFDSLAQAERFAQSDLYGEWMEKFESESGLIMLSLNWFETPRDILGTAAYSEPSDLSGVKLRLPPLAAWLDTFEPLGAVPVTLSWGEVYGGLQQGVIDAVESPVNTFAQGKFEEVADHLTQTQHILPWLGYAMGAQAFNRLSEGDQAILLEEFFKGGQTVTQLNAEKSTKSLDVLKAAGVEIHPANVAAYKAATTKFYSSSSSFPADLREQVLAAAK